MSFTKWRYITKPNKVILGEPNNDERIDRSCLLPRYLDKTLYVGMNEKTGNEGYKVIDRPYCGTRDIKCQTLLYGINTMNPLTDMNIMIDNGTYELNEIMMIEREVIITGENKENVIIIPIYSLYNSTSLFHIGNNLESAHVVILMVTFKYIPSIPPGEETHSLIFVEGRDTLIEIEDVIITTENNNVVMKNNIIIFKGRGYSQITLKNVKFENIILQKSLIDIVKGNGTFNGCNFTNIEINGGVSGSGGVAYVIVEMGKTIEFTDRCIFEDCTLTTTETGNGGALYADLNSGGIFTINKNTLFKNCTINSGIGKGYFFFFFFLLKIF
jgi:hypothetical protein